MGSNVGGLPGLGEVKCWGGSGFCAPKVAQCWGKEEMVEILQRVAVLQKVCSVMEERQC